MPPDRKSSSQKMGRLIGEEEDKLLQLCDDICILKLASSKVTTQTHRVLIFI